ncbi:MAG: serine--tRNA ligase [Candidatus Altiarchaeota archaeon]|nr:serine--tRNA ligase [Candidatus Altiarchaeota archaeon]
MIDINIVRTNPGLVRASLEKRGDPAKTRMLEDLIAKDREWRSLGQEVDSLKNSRNQLTKKIQELKTKGENASSVIEEAKSLPARIKEGDEKIEKLRLEVDELLMRIPNVLHDSVPFGRDESDNVVIKEWGKPGKPGFEVKHHGQLAVDLGIADFERAVKISGNGFFFLKGELAMLDLALQRLAIDILSKKGYVLVQPPFIMNRKPYEGVTDLSSFETVMYKVEGQDSYLIATSEHPMAAMHMNELFSEDELPIKYAGVSQCFRREIGKHGLDERGFFRVHQFNKVEQFVFCRPEDSWKFFEELARNCQELLEVLEIPYNVTNICTGDIGDIAAKKYDTNGWSVREQKYIELMSCSNCTDYQANRLGIRLKRRDGAKTSVHTLNNTMVATTRMLRIILENYQTPEGTLKVPKALQPYMNGVKEISRR